MNRSMCVSRMVEKIKIKKGMGHHWALSKMDQHLSPPPPQACMACESVVIGWNDKKRTDHGGSVGTEEHRA